MSFNDYWKEKVRRRHKTWESKSKRFAEKHTSLEEIRKEVFLPLDYNANYHIEDLIPLHFADQNPLVKWEKGVFSFSEDGIRAALEAQGADMSSFRMELSRESIEGKEAPLPENYFGLNHWDDYRYGKPNRTYDSDRAYFDWMKRMYRISTGVETVRLSYRKVSMTIRRYSNAGRPFAHYALNPCEQLCHGAILLQETDFYTFDAAMLLMDMAGEWELRREELDHYAKKLKIRAIEAVSTYGLDFTVWDEKKLRAKTAEYVGKGMPLEKIMEQVLRSWKGSVKKFISAAEERAVNQPVPTFAGFCKYSRNVNSFLESVFCPFMEQSDLDEAEVEISDSEYSMSISYHGARCRVYRYSLEPFIMPDLDIRCVSLPLSARTPLSAVIEYLKLMPEANAKVEEAVATVMREYDRLVNHREEFRADREFLEDLTGAHVGEPVGKLLKYMRWEVARLHKDVNGNESFPVRSLKVSGNAAFSFVLKDHQALVPKVPGGPMNIVVQDLTVNRWLDGNCRNVFPYDPAVTDIEEWKAAHNGSTGAVTVADFLRRYLPSYAPEVVSVTFVDKYL